MLERIQRALVILLAPIALGCGAGPQVAAKPADPPVVTLPAQGPLGAAPREDDVDAEQVKAACAAIAKRSHDALDALAAKGVSAKSIAKAKTVIGVCSPLKKGAIVLTVDDLAAAVTPPRDPFCDAPEAATTHPSALVPFGCFDAPCPDCVTGQVTLSLVAPPFETAVLTVGTLASTEIRMRSEDDEAVPTGASLSTLDHRVAAFFDANDDGWPEVLDCGTLHALGDREDLWSLSRSRCELLMTSPFALASSPLASAAGELSGELRMTDAGPELGVQTIDARDACARGEINVTLPDAFCFGPRLWARKSAGKFVAPLEDPSLRERFAAQCALAEGPLGEAAFGEMPSGTITAQVLCQSLKKGETPPARLPRDELAPFCGDQQEEGQCRTGDVIEGIYEALRDAVTRPSAK